MIRARRSPAVIAVLACVLAALTPGQAAKAGRADEILGSLPSQLALGLLERKWLILQEVDEDLGGLSGGYILAYVIFEKPRDEVYALLAQTARHGEFRSELRSVERIRELPDGVVDEHRIKMMLIKVVYRLRFRLQQAAGRIQWELDPEFDNDLDRAEGFWELHDMEGGRTLARFGTAVDVGAALPSSIQDMVTRSKVPKSIEACRRWVNSNGTYRP